MSFVEKLEKLCKQRGISLSKLAKEIGRGSATVTGWRKGSQPQASTIKLIADYLNVDMEYFLNENADEPIDYEKINTAEFNQTMWRHILKAHNYDEKKAIKAYLDFEKEQASDAATDPNRLSIYHNSGENYGLIGNAHAPVKIINGKEQQLSDNESEILRIFAELSFIEQSKVLVFAAELQEKSKKISPTLTGEANQNT